MSFFACEDESRRILRDMKKKPAALSRTYTSHELFDMCIHALGHTLYLNHISCSCPQKTSKAREK